MGGGRLLARLRQRGHADRHLDRLFLRGIGLDTVHSAAKTIPEMLFMIYQITFAIITVALIAGRLHRMGFSAFVWFAMLWLLIVYVPIAHGVWGGGFLMHRRACSTSRAARWCISMPASPDSSPPMWSATATATAPTTSRPTILSLAVIGTGLLWVGWFGFNGGSALGADSRAVLAIVATHLAAAVGALTWMAIEWWNRGKPWCSA